MNNNVIKNNLAMFTSLFKITEAQLLSDQTLLRAFGDYSDIGRINKTFIHVSAYINDTYGIINKNSFNFTLGYIFGRGHNYYNSGYYSSYREEFMPINKFLDEAQLSEFKRSLLQPEAIGLAVIRGPRLLGFYPCFGISITQCVDIPKFNNYYSFFEKGMNGIVIDWNWRARK